MWYTIITALFRCPSSADDLSGNSPRVCKPYLQVRTYVAPYIEPYYNAYAAPHVDRARPYVEKFDNQILTPSLAYGKQSYLKYGAPRVDQARTFGQDNWDKILKPQIDSAQIQAKQQYDSTLAPHVNKASAAASPYFTSTQNSLSQIYLDRLLPAYETSRPHIEKAYSFVHRHAVETGFPYAKSAWASTAVFLDRTLWPKLRILYGENVEPQLVRIGERLGRYRDGRKLEAAMDEADSTTTTSSSSSSFSSAASSVVLESSSLADTTTDSAVPTASPSATPEEEAEQTREKIESDLHNWQDRFAKAADKGIEDLEERVKEITDRRIEQAVKGVGEALVIQLEETSASEIAKLKKEIRHLVNKLPEEYDEDDFGKATLSLSRSTRSAGVAVKEKAQALRSWKENYDQETQSLVSAAAASTLDVIDNIRDLGLQEIGLRWAQMEGVTYKDWSKYHEVKKTFDAWRSKVESVAQDHQGLQASREASEEVEARGMAAAEETAKELARLKEVGKWKMEAGDATDDFDTKYIPAKAAAGAQKAMDMANSASEQVIGTSQGTIDAAVSEATQKASDAASSVSSAVIGTEPGIADQISESATSIASLASDAVPGTSTPLTQSVQSVASSVSSSASSAVSAAPRKVYGGAMAQKVVGQKPILDDVISDDDDATYSEKMQDMINQAGSHYADVTKAVSEALMGATTTQGTVESASSVADDQYSRALSAASSVLYGPGPAESATSVAAGRYSEAVAA